MALTISSQLGSHEITSLLGNGGMGEVYRARDLKLKREVAIKLLPEEFSRDADRVSRLQREAEVLASLSHPNIAGIYDIQESKGTQYLILELVEGETLADRIARGPIPLDEALPIAKQIAEALEAAHEKGIIHRDLKPANIKITPAGGVKVLDFGLAKAMDSESRFADVSNSPTLASMATNAGVILGTAAYMSPEQAKGRAVDRRTDVFAFGCVLYEMLTGKRAFDGEDATEILGAVVKMEPDWTKLPAGLPSSIRTLLRLSLEKNLKNRRSSATDVRLDIEASLKEEPAEATGRVKSAPVGWIAAFVAMALAGLLAVPAYRDFRTTAPPEMRVDITTPPTAAPLSFALSPNGRYIVFVASSGGAQELWLRALDKTEAQPLIGTEDADFPFWSPDSRSIGFFAGGKLKRVDIAGGPPQVLASTSGGRGGTWNADGTILYGPGGTYPITRVSASGSTPVEVTHVVTGQVWHRFPQFLPDGRHFVFFAGGTAEAAGVYLTSLDGGDPRQLTKSDTGAAWLAPDFLLFGRENTLLAQRLDLKQGRLVGDPITIGSVTTINGVGNSGFSVSDNGFLAYRGGGAASTQFIWYDRAGRRLSAAGVPETSLVLYPEISPDGQRVAYQRTVQGNSDVWLTDLLRGGLVRFTFDPAVDTGPVWSPDGNRILFHSSRKGPYSLYLKPSNGSGAAELIFANANIKYANDWSRDGRYILDNEVTSKSRDLVAIPVEGNDRKPIVIANTPFDEMNGQFSPDGHWVAYETNESGPSQIVAQPFPNPSAKWQVSTSGGIQPRWKPDGKEIYFIAPDGKLMAAPVTTSGGILSVGTPVALFATHLPAGQGTNKQEYAIARDGRFLLNEAIETNNLPITLIYNWKPQSVK